MAEWERSYAGKALDAGDDGGDAARAPPSDARVNVVGLALCDLNARPPSQIHISHALLLPKNGG